MEASFKVTVDELRKTMENPESLLKERDEILYKVNARMHGLKATFMPKQSEKQARTVAPKTDVLEVSIMSTNTRLELTEIARRVRGGGRCLRRQSSRGGRGGRTS